MSSNIPIVRQIAWLSIIPQLIIIVLMMLIWYQFDKRNFMILSALSFLVIALILRKLIAKEHQNGIVKVKHEQFKDAILHFETSYNYFKQHNWIDKYRFLTLFSASKISYKEMALVNIAFCYGQIGEGKLSKSYYQKAIDEFPESKIAKTGLNFLNSMNEND